jgi:peptidoglycan/LPS O-acetylase OafA/YrhL
MSHSTLTVLAPEFETTGISSRDLAGGRILAIDGLRALAMLMVFGVHTWQFSNFPPLQVGPISIGARLGVFGAGVSYSIFLLHQSTMYYLGQLMIRAFHVSDPARFGVFISLGFAITVAIAYVFFRAFERPFLSRRARAIDRRVS